MQDVPAFHVVAGNPARIIRKIETRMDPESNLYGPNAETSSEKASVATPL